MVTRLSGSSSTGMPMVTAVSLAASSANSSPASVNIKTAQSFPVGKLEAVKESKALAKWRNAASKVEMVQCLSGHVISLETSELQAKLAEASDKKSRTYVDCTDLSALWNALRGELEHVRKVCFSDTQTSCDGIRTMLKDTTDLAEKGNQAYETLQTVEPAHGKLIVATEALREDLSALQAKVQERGIQRIDNLEDQFGKLSKKSEDSEIKSMEFQMQINDSMAEITTMCNEARRTADGAALHLQESLVSLRRDMSDLQDKMRSTSAEVRRMETNMKNQINALSEQEAKDISGLQGSIDKTDAALRAIDAKLDEEIAASHKNAQTARDGLRTEFGNEVAEIQKDLKNVSIAVSEASNANTRRVEWIIRNASSSLLHGGEQEAPRFCESVSLASKKFEAAGAKGLQLEVVRYKESSINGSDIRDAALRLFAVKGLRLVCRLSIGETTCHVDHFFDREEPYVTARLCLLSEQIHPEDDTLRISVDVLEAVRTFESLSNISDLGVTFADDDGSDPNSFVFHRYLNHRMLDLVQAQVDVMNSRMTRKVVWRIEQAGRLPKCFAEGEAMCSATFLAAGLEGLQLVFYPSGFTGAKSGYCSCFVFSPGSSSMRCWLSVGNQRREAKVSFTTAGFYGRTNFCRLDQCIDPVKDEVEVMLEIGVAHQDELRSLSHQTSNSHMITGRPETSCSVMSGVGETSTVDSVLKLQRTSGHLEEVKQLPSIWTAKLAGDIDKSLEGFHHMTDLRHKKRPNSRMQPIGNTAGGSPDGKNGALSNTSMYSNSPGPLSQREYNSTPERPGSRCVTSMSVYSNVHPPATARPTSTNHVRGALCAKYAAYMG